MPTYVYKCPKCDLEVEKEHSIKMLDLQLVICQDCAIDMERIPVKTSFILKGDGWAKTGYSKG